MLPTISCAESRRTNLSVKDMLVTPATFSAWQV